MKYLIDTHVFVWLDGESRQLSPKIAGLCKDRNNQLVLSLASVWEMQIKFQLGKMELRNNLDLIIEEQRQINQIELLPVTLAHILSLRNLPPIHHDPFDRILIAQAISEGLTFISYDSNIAQYPVQVLW